MPGPVRCSSALGRQRRRAVWAAGSARASPAPKSRTFARPSLGDEDVRRLDVAVDDAALVGRVQRVGDLDAEVEQAVGVQRLVASSPIERLPSSNSIAMNGSPSCSSIVVDRADVGWLSALAARASRWNRSIAGRSLASSSRQELQRDAPAELLVLAPRRRRPSRRRRGSRGRGSGRFPCRASEGLKTDYGGEEGISAGRTRGYPRANPRDVASTSPRLGASRPAASARTLGRGHSRRSLVSQPQGPVRPRRENWTVAERAGFEPAVRLPHTRFPSVLLKPLGHLSGARNPTTGRRLS